MSGCPSTRSAGWSIVVGILFQIKMRLKPVSATNRRVPSEVTDVGVYIVFAATVGGGQLALFEQG